MSAEKTRIVEEKMARLFSEKKSFSEHLYKWEDPFLPDKYDHNCFEYTDQPTREEFQKAVDYQRNKGDNFIKLEGDHPLSDFFGLEPCVTVTMVLKKDTKKWTKNRNVRFAVPSLEDLESIEVKHYGLLYGESFTRRNARRLYDKFQYHGAYMGDQLVAACYSFGADGMTCIDGLIVDEEYRHQYIATALMAHIAETNADSILFLHADEEDTPKDMYLKMGFEITDHLYEYSCTNLHTYVNNG
jgi:GNAT superfamily N-acetyltransferase